MLEYSEIIKNLNILLVDDDQDFIDIAKMYLTTKGYNITIVNSGMEALEALAKEKYHIMLIDYFMPEMSGEEVVNKVREFNKQLIIILQTGFSGQKPPVEMMQKLNIQNYHDKTEGMGKLNLQIMSAVKVFNQQNEIAIARYRTNAIGKIMSAIASSLKSNLLTIAASMEVTSMITENREHVLTDQEANILKDSYAQNKETLEKVDKILTAIIKGSSLETNDYFSDSEIVEVIKIILVNELREKEYNLTCKSMLRNTAVISGPVADIIFVMAELVMRLTENEIENKDIEFILTEDELNWYFKVETQAVAGLDANRVNILKNIAITLGETEFVVSDDTAMFVLKKK